MFLLICGAEAREPALGVGGGWERGEGTTEGSSQRTDYGWCPKYGHASAPWIRAARPYPGPNLPPRLGLQPTPPPPQHDLRSRKGSIWHFRSLLPSTSDKSALYPLWEQPPSVCWETAPHLHSPIHFQSVETSSKEEGGMRKGVEENKKRKKQENKANKENTRFPGGVKTCISEKRGGKP